MKKSERLLLNTSALYLNSGICTLLLLLSSRFVLAALGVEGYGLYAVIAGIMGFMGFLNAAMASGSQRHLAYELGREDHGQLKRVFGTCLGIHLGMMLLLVVFGESAGLWFLKHVLNIPEAQREAAFWIYQFTILYTVVRVLSVPYQALLSAREAFVVVAILGVIQAVLAFLVALVIGHVGGERVVVYVFLMFVIGLGAGLAQAVYCWIRYPECRVGFRYLVHGRLTREILSFSSWNLYGALSTVARLQGPAFLLNVFFGTAINAAYGIASQVGGQVSQLTMTMLLAINPQMVKSEGAGNREQTLSLSLLISKYAFFLDSFWMFPLFAELPTIFHLWLRQVPEHTVAFSRLILLLFAFEKLSSGFGNVVQAIGRIAMYQFVVGSIIICTLPLGYIALKFGYPPTSVLWLSLFTMLIATFVRAWFVHRMTGMPYGLWLKAVLLRALCGVMPAGLLAAAIYTMLPAGLVRLLVIAAVTALVMPVGIFLLGMDAAERGRWLNLLRSFLIRFPFAAKLMGSDAPV
jgi:O-antigen/teichoic acid export membrane protein